MVSCKGLVDSGAPISTITKSFDRALGLKNYSLYGLLDIEETGEIEVPYKAYVEVSLEIQEIGVYKQNVLTVLLPDSKYGNKVPIHLGTQIIDTVSQVSH